MTRKELFLQTLKETHLISVIRIHEKADMVPVMESLCKGGVKIIEITATTPAFAENIKAIRKAFETKEDIFAGAGTVLTHEQLDAALEAGADFVVSPVFDPSIVSICVKRGVPVMPGAMTPTEIHAVWKAGATVVKTFPGRVCTPGFYADMKGPFPDIKMMPTGNVNKDTAPEYIKAGAVAVGVGKAIADEDLIVSGNWKAIEENARFFSSLLRDL